MPMAWHFFIWMQSRKNITKRFFLRIANDVVDSHVVVCIHKWMNFPFFMFMQLLWFKAKEKKIYFFNIIFFNVFSRFIKKFLNRFFVVFVIGENLLCYSDFQLFHSFFHIVFFATTTRRKWRNANGGGNGKAY